MVPAPMCKWCETRQVKSVDGDSEEFCSVECAKQETYDWQERCERGEYRGAHNPTEEQ
jgi:hypothetical protein